MFRWLPSTLTLFKTPSHFTWLNMARAAAPRLLPTIKFTCNFFIARSRSGALLGYFFSDNGGSLGKTTRTDGAGHLVTRRPYFVKGEYEASRIESPLKCRPASFPAQIISNGKHLRHFLRPRGDISNGDGCLFRSDPRGNVNPVGSYVRLIKTVWPQQWPWPMQAKALTMGCMRSCMNQHHMR